MPSIPKPNSLSLIWAAQGTKTAPEPDKINQGWVVELPPYQTANYIENKQDQFIAHVNQYGIPIWDNTTEYQGGKSLAQGSNGVVYKCTSTHTGADPTNPLNSNRWKIAFEEYGNVAILQAEVNAFRTNYNTLNALTNKEAARINLQVYSRIESDDRFAPKAGSSGTAFSVAYASLPAHAVPLGQLNSLLAGATTENGGVARFATATEVKQGSLTNAMVSPDTGRQAYLMQSNNLSDLQSPATARSNLGLTSTATTPSQTFVSAISLVGQVATFAGTTSPAGWIICDGRAVSRAVYSDLFSVVGTTYGAGDGVSTFNVPDCRNEFIRGWTGNTSSVGQKFTDTLGSHSHIASVADSGWHAHTASTGGAGYHAHSGATDTQGAHTHSVKEGNAGPAWIGGDVLTSGDDYTQSIAYYSNTLAAGAHSHNLSINAVGDHVHSVSVAGAGTHSHSVSISATGSGETRPRGIYMLICIRH
tara:strand:- start:18611 stop:20035 length:1425 start_codon:yes stop_codon:yes gene_type:complete